MSDTNTNKLNDNKTTKKVDIKDNPINKVTNNDNENTTSLLPVKEKHNHGEGHNHDHHNHNHDSHDDNSDDTLNKLWTVSVVCLIFMSIELVGGYLASSIAIMSDAAHLLSDILGFIISIISIYISRRKASKKMTYGYNRAEVIGALVSVNIIWGLTIWLLFEATNRIINSVPVNGGIMIIVGVLGFGFNIIMGWILHKEGIGHMFHDHDHGDHDHDGHSHEHHDHKHENKESKNTKDDKHESITKEETDHEYKSLDVIDEEKHDHDHKDCKHDHKTEEKKDNHNHKHDHGHGHSHGDLNLQAAYIHVIGDALQNLGVIIAGVIIYYFPEYHIADSIVTYIFSLIVAYTTIDILKNCLSILMEGVPVSLNLEQLEKDLNEIPNISQVHDLHVWSIKAGQLAMSCHITSKDPNTLSAATKLIKETYKIDHITIQIEGLEGTGADSYDKCNDANTCYKKEI